MTKKICVLPGDGIGPEIMAEAVRVLKAMSEDSLFLAGDKAVIIDGPPGSSAGKGSPRSASTFA